jgi:hypothetical protein
VAPSNTPQGAPSLCEKTGLRKSIRQATTMDTANPASIAVPPIRGIGTRCTSRSRTGVIAPIRRAIRRTKGVSRYVTAAATINT